MPAIVISLIFCLFMVPSIAMEEADDRKIRNEIKDIIQKQYPGFLNKHLRIIDELDGNFKENAFLSHSYACKESFVFTQLADHLSDSALKLMSMQKKSYSKFEGIQILCKNFMEDNCTIQKGFKNSIFLHIKIGDSEIVTQIKMMDFVWNVFLNPCLYYYSIARNYEINKQDDYDKKIELVKNSFKKYFSSVELP